MTCRGRADSLAFRFMKALVTSKGQVTIPKELREKYGIAPGAEVDFVAAEDGIRLRKVTRRRKTSAVFGCLKDELGARSVGELLDELRGPAELPAKVARKANRR